MDAGGIVATSCWTIFVALLLYGAGCDLRRWLHRGRHEEEQPDEMVWHVDWLECDAEEQAAYTQALHRAEIELAFMLPATLACPRAER